MSKRGQLLLRVCREGRNADWFGLALMASELETLHMTQLLRISVMASALSIFALVVGCSGDSGQEDAKSLANAITDSTSSSAEANNETCKLFSRDEVSAALGISVDEVANWSYGGCEWKADDQSVHVQVAAARYYTPLAKSSGGETLTGIGKAAFVGPALLGFTAAALLKSRCVYVTAPTRDMAVELLRLAVNRMTSP